MGFLTIAAAVGVILAGAGLFLFWRTAFHQSTGAPIPIVTYHHVEKTPPGISTTRVATHSFEKQIELLWARGYHAVAPDFFLNGHSKNGKRKILITFDDCYQSVYTDAIPCLLSYGLTATLFVISDFLGNQNRWDVRLSPSHHMTQDQLQSAVNRGFSLGSHTRTHRDLTQLSPGALKEELQGSKKFIEDSFRVPVNFLAYPFGRFNTRVKNAAREAGYKAAFTINRPLFNKGFDLYCIPSAAVYRFDGLRNFISKIEKDQFSWLEDVKGKILNRFASGAALIKGGPLST